MAKGRTPRVYRSFVSTLVLATYREYADTLRANGVVTATRDNAVPFHYRVNMQKLLGMIADGRTWNDIGIEHQSFPNSNKVAVSSDVCRSNTAVSYLGLVAYVANDNRLPMTTSDALDVALQVEPILARQGMPTSFLFDQYISQDARGISPVVVADERQAARSAPDERLRAVRRAQRRVPDGGGEPGDCQPAGAVRHPGRAPPGAPGSGDV